MGRRSFASKGEPDPGSGSRPSLESVLHHYDVEFREGRASQMVRCPIHGDVRSPSMSVDLVRQLVNCHSCGFGGDAWSLIMKKEDTDFAGARRIAESALGFTAGESGGSGSDLRVGTRFGSRPLPGGQGSQRGNRAYRPSWRGR